MLFEVLPKRWQVLAPQPYRLLVVADTTSEWADSPPLLWASWFLTRLLRRLNEPIFAAGAAGSSLRNHRPSGRGIASSRNGLSSSVHSFLILALYFVRCELDPSGSSIEKKKCFVELQLDSTSEMVSAAMGRGRGPALLGSRADRTSDLLFIDDGSGHGAGQRSHRSCRSRFAQIRTAGCAGAA
jgi:hypothetical protein